MSFADAISSFFRNYVNFTGRARRSELWYSFLFVFIVQFAAGFIDGLFFGQQSVFSFVVCAAIFIPYISVAVRRLHDINKSGWFFLVYLIPFVGWIFYIVWGVQDTYPAANQWGEPAKPVYGGAQTPAV